MRHLLSASAMLGLSLVAAAQTDKTTAPPTQLQVETILEGLDQPWAIAFIDAQRWLITERPGKLRLVVDGVLREAPLDGVPEVYAAGQGGLLEVVVDPDFADNQRIYLSYAHGNPKANATRVVRARLQNERLGNVQVLFTAQPLKATPVHYGGRMAFLPDRTLLLGLGDGFNQREAAQDLGSHLGKLIRIDRDGNPPDDNPYLGRNDALPEIWSFGHRNIQGLVWHGGINQVLAHEHGPRGGDELNLIAAGSNYGWPLASCGIDYSGARISPYQSYPGTVDSLHHWTPSIAPAGMTVVAGPLFPDWQGDLLITALAGRALHRLSIDGDTITEHPPLLRDLEQRLRDVRMGPDGAIYVLTDGKDGRLLRLLPAAATGDGEVSP
jgi:glucose/arabinose dehydrogenase